MTPQMENSTLDLRAGFQLEHRQIKKDCRKLPSRNICKMCMKQKLILCLVLGPILNMSHYVYANIPKS
jgi:hypothetical protein